MDEDKEQKIAQEIVWVLAKYNLSITEATSILSFANSIAHDTAVIPKKNDLTAREKLEKITISGNTEGKEKVIEMLVDKILKS